MSGKSFKVKTADGEVWEWDIRAPDETRDSKKLLKEEEDDELEWNKPAVASLVVGLALCFFGLLILLISIGLLFSSAGAAGGIIAGAVLLGAGFIVSTPSAVYLTREAAPRDPAGDARGRSESVAIILPAPEFRKHTVMSKPQESSSEDKKYLLAAERLTAMLEEPETEAAAVSTAAWTPTPSPKGSPTLSESPPPSFGASLSVPTTQAPGHTPRGSPRVIRRVNSSSVKKNKPDPPLTFSAEPSSEAVVVHPNTVSFAFAPKTEEIDAQPASTAAVYKHDSPLTVSAEPSDAIVPQPNVISFTFAPKTEEIEAQPVITIDEAQEADIEMQPASTVNAAHEIGDVNSAAAANEEDARDAENAENAADAPSEDNKVEIEMTFEPHLSPPVVESVNSVNASAPYISPSGSFRLKVAAPVAAPSVTEFDGEDENLKQFLLSVERQKAKTPTSQL